MKKGTLVMLSVAAVAGMTSLSNATPIGVNDFTSGGGASISQTARNGGGTTVAQNAQNIGPVVSQGAPIGGTSSQNAQVNSVPVPGTLLMLGAGFFLLALWYEFRQRILS